MILVCHLILQDYVMRGSCGLYGQEHIKVSYHPAKFGGHRLSGSRDIML